jgi:hypothetical protein
MAQSNISFDGSPVQFRLESPLVVCFDPCCAEFVLEEMSAMTPDSRANIRTVLWRMNGSFSVMSCFLIADFHPGLFTLDPCDIRKFGDDDEDFSYDELEKEEDDPTIDPTSYQFAGTDSATLILVDFARLFDFVSLFRWENYDLSCRGDNSVFANINGGLGTPCFALVSAGGLPDMECDGDGTFTINAGAIRACSR